MKCLRCGKEMGSKMECSCGHFYENNLENSSKNNLKFIKKTNSNNNYQRVIYINKSSGKIISIQHAILIIVLFICIVAVIFILLFMPMNPVKGLPPRDFCTTCCENDSFIIEDDICICSDGRRYSFHK